MHNGAMTDTSLVTYVALLRGINVGGNAIVRMADLKSCFEGLRFKNVRTFINSGNVMFQSPARTASALEKLIEAGIKKRCKMEIRVTVRSYKDLAAVCKKIPEKWVTDKATRTDVMFLWPDVDYPKIVSEIPSNPDVDRLVYVKGAVVWNVDRADYPKSKVPKMVGSTFYKNMTARNSNTTRKLLALMSE
jgi:uncharacterized protein (DUF1697 family)